MTSETTPANRAARPVAIPAPGAPDWLDLATPAEIGAADAADRRTETAPASP